MATRPNTQGGASAPSTVVAIRPRVRIPEANRREDQEAITHRRLIMASARTSEIKHGTDEHGDADHIAAVCIERRAAEALPCSNLRLIPKPSGNPEQCFWEMLKRYSVAEAELKLAEAQFTLALHLVSDDEAARDALVGDWCERRDDAREAREAALFDLARYPVDRLWLHELKRKHAGARKWLANYRKSLAAILDEEETRLLAEKAERMTARAAKRKGEL